jgi:hypothetical protein|uniref:Uncharacterized protein n=1 Tax=Zea mays TaxID=4577 RepID=A0A804RGG0_MAIZE
MADELRSTSMVQRVHGQSVLLSSISSYSTMNNHVCIFCLQCAPEVISWELMQLLDSHLSWHHLLSSLLSRKKKDFSLLVIGGDMHKSIFNFCRAYNGLDYLLRVVFVNTM